MTFEENLEIFRKLDPKTAHLSSLQDCPGYRFSRTAHHELNLERVRGDKVVYYHSQEDAHQEAQKWFQELNLSSEQAIFVWGIGLGYYYEVARMWLKEDPKRYIIFYEHDLSVIRCFLDTPLATEILSNPQVIIKHFELPTEFGWKKFREEFDWFFYAFAFYQSRFSSLKLYQETDPEIYKKMSWQILSKNLEQRYFFRERYWGAMEWWTYDNWYSNFLYLSENRFAQNLFGQFPNVPAIICGAGPSLNKQLPLLKQVEDKAIIFGAGSAMNILNQFGINVHFGGGVDPSHTQYSRTLTSQAFNTPYFFRNRFNKKSLQMLHGEHLYTTGGEDYRICDWFEDKIGLHGDVEVIRGVSTTNFCFDIAALMGCDPIILLGVDFAYTTNRRYSPGVTVHPGDVQHEKTNLTALKENLMEIKDVNGATVSTTLEWIRESELFAFTVQNYPEKKFFNATEGGMGIVGIPNVPFQKLVDQYLATDFDLLDRLHQEIQSISKIKGVSENILKEWQQSLRRALEYSRQIHHELMRVKIEVDNGKSSFSSIFNPKAVLYDTELKAEPAFTYFLEIANHVYDKMVLLEEYRFQREKDSLATKDQILKQLSIELGRYELLIAAAEEHLGHVERALVSYKENISQMNRRKPIPEVRESDESNQKLDYVPELVPEEMKKSPSTEIYGTRSGLREGQCLLYYPDRTLKGEMFYRQGQLEGPVTFFSKEGKTLAKSWYVKGKREGKSLQYYPSGTICSVFRHKNGSKEGLQETYYEDGAAKTLLHYKNDKLDGEVKVFHPNGKLEREMHFWEGKLQGSEKMWDLAGFLVSEAEYEHGLPIGRARHWYPNGQLAREVIYRGSPEQFDFQEWNDKGDLIAKDVYLSKDILSDMKQKSQQLQKSIDLLNEQLNKLKNSKKDLPPTQGGF